MALNPVGKAAEFLFGQVGMTHRFVVQIDQMTYDLGDWSRVSGLGVTWTPVAFRTGDSNQTWIAAGNATYQNISLSRAACSDSETVQNWLKSTSRSNAALSGAIKMTDFLGMTVVEWKLKEFFPIGWKIVEFDASGSKAAVETLDLAHTGFLDDEMKYG
jgi:phage tail-like protein